MRARARQRAVLACALGLSGIGAGGQAFAACSVTASGLVFGNYDTNNAAPSDTAMNIQVDCQSIPDSTVSHAILLGMGGSNSYVARQMGNGASRLAYNLYTSSAHSAVWGDGSGGSAVVSDTYSVGAIGTSKKYTVYGSMAARQNVAAGMYADVIMVTVTY